MTEGLQFRVGNNDDYDSVMTISGDIFGGVDYMPSQYHQLLAKKDVLPVLAFIKDKLVGMNIIEPLAGFGGKYALTRAARVHPEHQGRGIFQALNQHMKQLYMGKHLKTEDIVYCSVGSRFHEERIKSEDRRFVLIGKYNIFGFDVSAGNTKVMVEAYNTEQHHRSTSVLNISDGMANWEHLSAIVKDSLFISDIWTPVENCQESFKDVLSNHHTLVTRDPHNQSNGRFLAISFLYDYNAKYGRVCLLYYHGDTQYLEEHIIKQLQFVSDSITDEKVAVVGVIPGDVDISAVDVFIDKHHFQRGPHKDGTCLVIKETMKKV